MGLNHHDFLVAVHAFFACLATLFILPSALFVARFLRGKNPRWVRIHIVLTIWGAIMIVIAFGLGLASVMLNPPEPPPDENTDTDDGSSATAADGGTRRRREVALMARILKRWVRRHGDGDEDEDDTGDDSQFIGPEATFHHKMGLCLLILIFLQVAWGFTTRYLAQSQERKRKKKSRQHSSTIGDDGRSITPVPSEDEDEDEDANARTHARVSSRSKRPSKRHWTQYTHIFFGIGLLILLYIQCWNGLHTEWPNMSEHGDPAPTAILVIFWILVAIPVGPYGIHVLSRLLHKSRDGGEKPSQGGRQDTLKMEQRSDHVRLSDRIVVGGPSSTAAVALQQQQEEIARESYRHSREQSRTSYGGNGNEVVFGSHWAPDRTV